MQKKEKIEASILEVDGHRKYERRENATDRPKWWKGEQASYYPCTSYIPITLPPFWYDDPCGITGHFR